MFNRLTGAVVVVGAVAILAAAVPAQAGLAVGRGPGRARPAAAPLPAVQPATGTPSFPPATTPVEQIRQLVQCGSVMYAVGKFSVVQQGSATYQRSNAFSFAATAPFTVTSWNPSTNGIVNSISFNSGHCADAYLGGQFTRVGGQPARNIAEVSTSGAGLLVPGFAHSANAEVETLASYQNHVLAGGFFTRINGGSADPYLVSLDATTGKNDRLLRLRVVGHLAYKGVAPNATKIYNQQISHSGKLDLVEGDFATIGGHRRRQIFMLNLASRPAFTLTAWTSPRFDGSRGYPPHGYYYNCSDAEPFYIRSAAWSPDDKVIYMASTGFRPWNGPKALPVRGLCDAAAAFSADPSRPNLKWINYTGCDSLYSVAADGQAAFFGGHERYSDNASGCNAAGPGAIADPGMEGLTTGKGKLLLNPSGTALYTRGRGLGADDMLRTLAGLWIASDNFSGTQTCDGVSGLAGICFLPYLS